MKAHFPADFESTVFPEIFIFANPNFKQSANINVVNEPIDSQISARPIPNEKNKFAAELRVKLDARNSESIPYSFNIVCLTIFTVEDVVPEDQRDGFALQAAHIIAFPAVRELILSLTARQPWGQFSIGVSILNPAEKPEQQKTPARTEIKAQRVGKKKTA